MDNDSFAISISAKITHALYSKTITKSKGLEFSTLCFIYIFIGSVIYDWAKVAHANYEIYEVVKL